MKRKNIRTARITGRLRKNVSVMNVIIFWNVFLSMIWLKGKVMLQNNGNYLKLVFRLTNHQQKAIEGKELKESLIFCIDDNISLKTVYEKKIEFDETYFTNILNSEKAQKIRNQELIDIAAELMPPLI